MKHKRLLTVLIAIALLAAGFGLGALAAGTFGTQSDPLVTKSYLDSVLTPRLRSEYEQQLNSEVDELTGMIDSLETSGGFVSVGLARGKTLSCYAGCEIVLISGTAAVSGSALSNVTVGASSSVGTSVAKHNLYVCPTDGGGVKASAETVVLVRGAYAIV
ncbi:MAG: hypothetical protein LBM18_01725 [Oscillospiraceae bacterium]|jgi:hypothetical protein|nr:hypothetical protein [Oscillospiraceae bacterium]